MPGEVERFEIENSPAAERRGCRLIALDSHSFQAPAFYQRLGYELWAALDGYPSPHRQCYLRKTLR